MLIIPRGLPMHACRCTEDVQAHTLKFLLARDASSMNRRTCCPCRKNLPRIGLAPLQAVQSARLPSLRARWRATGGYPPIALHSEI